MNCSLKLKSVTALLIATLLFSLGKNSGAQEQKPPTLPLPEMQRLSKLYAGTWTYTETYPKSAFSPNGGVSTGVYTSELGPGGNSIINHFHSKGPVGEFEGVMVMTWDPKEKALMYSAIPFPRRSLKLANGKVTFLFIAASFPQEVRSLRYET
jgi:hypothetical protein